MRILNYLKLKKKNKELSARQNSVLKENTSIKDKLINGTARCFDYIGTISNKYSRNKALKRGITAVLAVIIFVISLIYINPASGSASSKTQEPYSVGATTSKESIYLADDGDTGDEEWSKGIDSPIGQNEDKVYEGFRDSFSTGNPNALDEFESRHEWISDVVGFIIAVPGFALSSLLSGNVDLSLGGLILGRVYYGNETNWVGFELQDKNPYGVVGATLYYYLRTVMYAVVPFICLFLLFKKITGSGDAQKNISVRLMFRDVLFFFALLIIAPALVDILLFIRDSCLKGLVNIFSFNSGNADILGRYETLYKFGGGITKAILFTAAAIACFTYLKSYIAIACKQTILFGMFPVFGLLGIKDSKIFGKWLNEFIVNLFIPCLDFVLILMPLKIYEMAAGPSMDINTSITVGDLGDPAKIVSIGSSDNVPFGISLIVILMFGVVVSTRDKIVQLLGGQGGLTARSGFGGFMMAAAMALRSIGGTIKNHTPSNDNKGGDTLVARKDDIEAVSSSIEADRMQASKYIELANNDIGGGGLPEHLQPENIGGAPNKDADLEAVDKFVNGDLTSKELQDMGIIDSDSASEIGFDEVTAGVGAGVAVNELMDYGTEETTTSSSEVPISAPGTDTDITGEVSADTYAPEPIKLDDIPTSYDEFEQARGENFARLDMAEKDYADAKASVEMLEHGNLNEYAGSNADMLHNAQIDLDSANSAKSIAEAQFNTARDMVSSYSGDRSSSEFRNLESELQRAQNNLLMADKNSIAASGALEKAKETTFKEARERLDNATAVRDKYRSECSAKEKAFSEYAKTHDGFTKTQKAEYSSSEEYIKARKKEEIEKKFTNYHNFDSAKAKDVLTFSEKAQLYRERANINEARLKELEARKAYTEQKERQAKVINTVGTVAKATAGAFITAGSAGIGAAAGAVDGDVSKGAMQGAMLGAMSTKMIGSKIPRADASGAGAKYDNSHPSVEKMKDNPIDLGKNKGSSYKGQYNATIDRTITKAPKKPANQSSLPSQKASIEHESSFEKAVREHKRLVKEGEERFLGKKNDD